jgi:hypothetical protein
VDVTTSDPRVLTFCGAATGDRTGTAVAAAGDVNGDGYPDLLIGAPGTVALGLQPQGRLYVIFGGPSLQSIDLSTFDNGTQAIVPGSGFLIKGPLLNLTLNSTAVPFGAQLATRHLGDDPTDGDVNGDGLDDIVIGASGSNDNLRLDSGTVYVIYGKTDGGTVDLGATGGVTQGANQLNPAVDTGFRIFGASIGDQTGQSTALVGSVDQSGFASIVVTAPGVVSPHGGTASGAAYVLFGSTTPQDIDLANFGGPNRMKPRTRASRPPTPLVCSRGHEKSAV